MFEKITKKKLALMFLAGIALPLGLTAIGLPLWVVTPVSLVISCVIDGVILYKIGKWIWKKPVIHN